MSDKSLLPYAQAKVVWCDMELVTTRRLQIWRAQRVILTATACKVRNLSRFLSVFHSAIQIPMNGHDGFVIPLLFVAD